MIADLLTLDRPLIVLDLETTGTEPGSRIVEIGFQVYAAAGMTKEWSSLVNPGIPIPADSTRVHHITDNDMLMCRKCGKLEIEHRTWPGNVAVNPLECPEFHAVPTFAQLAPNLAKGFTACDFAGKNVRFDLGILSSEFTRVGVPWSYSVARILDADRLEQLGEPRDLTSLYKRRCGKDLVGAHGALADVRATAELIEAQLMYFQDLPRNIDLLHEKQWPGFIDGEGKFRMKDGEAICAFGKYRGKSMKNIPSGYWQWLARADFSNEVKMIASEALAGRYPR